jgi:hypothetical protein
MFRRPGAHRVPRIFTSMALASALIVAFAVPVNASFSSNVTAYPILSRCIGRSPAGDPMISWRGGEGFYAYYWDPRVTGPRGEMYFCYYTYRLGTKTADGDYYAVDLKTVWRVNSSTWDWMPAVMKQSVSSNKSSKDSVYDWTPTKTSSSGCSTSVSVGFGVGPISISTSMAMCSGETTSLYSHSSTGATWRASYAGRIRTVETSFVQKVAHGSVPTFTIKFVVPYYTYTPSSALGIYWVITPKWDTYTYTATGTV